MVDYKHCQITKTESGEYILSGAKRSFGSLRELLNCYQKEALRTDGYTFQLIRCCPPSHKGQCSHPEHVCDENENENVKYKLFSHFRIEGTVKCISTCFAFLKKKKHFNI